MHNIYVICGIYYEKKEQGVDRDQYLLSLNNEELIREIKSLERLIADYAENRKINRGLIDRLSNEINELVADSE